MIDPPDDDGPPPDHPRREGGRNDPEPFSFDPALLADPDAESDLRNREWSRFCDHFGPRLRSYFQGRTDPDELEETIAHIWRRAFLHIGGLRSPAAAWSWLTTVGENFLNGERRSDTSRRRTRQAAAPSLELEERLRRQSESALERLSAMDAFEGGGWPIDRATFEERWSRLAPDDRWLIHMRVQEELEFTAIAQRMGIQSSAARKRFSRARQMLRDG